MTAVLLPQGKQQFFTTVGVPAVGYKLATFAAGTSSNQATWADALQIGANPNPIILDGRGEAVIFWNGAYKVQLQDATGAIIWTVDNIQSTPAPTASLIPGVDNSFTLGSPSFSWANVYVGVNHAAVLDTVSGNIGYYARTTAEIAAGIAPVNFVYPELDVRRYGALSTNTGAQNAVAIQAGVSVLAQRSYGELLIPQGLVLNITQVTFTSLTKFNVRCDGILNSTAAAVAGAFVNQTSSQGVFSPFNFTTCTKFKVYGKGYINNGFVDAFFISGCSDFKWSLDLRGSCTNSAAPTGNSNMNGATIVGCSNFQVSNCVIDSICSQNMNNVTDVYYAFMNNLFLASANTDFEIGPSVRSRKAGYAAFYVGSNCAYFSIHDCIGELCSGTACQLAWTGGGVVPANFTIANNTWLNNQEDALCVQNNAGGIASIGSNIVDNKAIWTGWCNCSSGTTALASNGGAGINLAAVADVTIAGNACNEHTTAGIYLNQCSRISGSVGEITQSLAATAIGLYMLGGSTDIKLSGGTVNSAGATATSLLRVGTCTDVHLSNIAFPAGQISDSGVTANCKMNNISATCPGAVAAQCDWIDSDLAVTGGGAQGLVVAGGGVKLIRCKVTSPSNAIVLNATSDCLLEGTTGTSSTGVGIQVIASSGVALIGCQGTSNSGVAISLSGACDRPVLINCKGISTSSNALNMASASVTNATLISFRNITGTITTTGATFLAGMNIP